MRYRPMILSKAPDFKTYLAEIPDGESGIRQILKIARKVVRHYRYDPAIRQKAISIASVAPGKNYTVEVKALFEYVRDSIRYVGDATDSQTMQTPDVTLYVRSGNCMQKAILLAAMLESINHKTRFKAIGYDPEAGYEHVFLETLIGRDWVPLDASEDQPFGWEPPRPYGLPPIIENN